MAQRNLRELAPSSGTSLNTRCLEQQPKEMLAFTCGYYKAIQGLCIYLRHHLTLHNCLRSSVRVASTFPPISVAVRVHLASADVSLLSSWSDITYSGSISSVCFLFIYLLV